MTTTILISTVQPWSTLYMMYTMVNLLLKWISLWTNIRVACEMRRHNAYGIMSQQDTSPWLISLGLLFWCPIFYSLQLIWRSGTRRFYLRVPVLRMSCSDLTYDGEPGKKSSKQCILLTAHEPGCVLNHWQIHSLFKLLFGHAQIKDIKDPPDRAFVKGIQRWPVGPPQRASNCNAENMSVPSRAVAQYAQFRLLHSLVRCWLALRRRLHSLLAAGWLCEENLFSIANRRPRTA